MLSQSLAHPVIVFNFGTTGAGPVTELLHLRQLLAQGLGPDLLLIEVLPPLLAGQASTQEAPWWDTWPVPWYTYRHDLLDRWLPVLVPYAARKDWLYRMDDSGWTPGPAKPPSPERYQAAVERTRREYAVYFQSFQLQQEPCQAVREALELCRRRHIRAGLVLMPEASLFRSWYAPSAWDQVTGFLGRLEQEFGVLIVNARTWIPDEEFSDGHHLLLGGADHFTDRLGREVLTPLLTSVVARSPDRATAED
jgi:hypothetical protein